MHLLTLFQVLKQGSEAQACAGLGGFLLLTQGGGKDGLSSPCAGLGGFLLFSHGGGYGGSGLSPAQASQHPDTRMTLSISL